MGRPTRYTPGGHVYHALNRANARLPIFTQAEDFEAFERILLESLARTSGMRLLAYCLMPNHWHLVLFPTRDGDVSQFLHWLTLTHSQRWKAHHRQVGVGHLYQGRFKSFPVQEDEHFLTVCRYVERNPLRAGLVERAEAWRWGSLWHRENAPTEMGQKLTEWPVPRPQDWAQRVNTPLTEAELETLRVCVNRGRPFGSLAWMAATAGELGLGATLRKRGRPPTVREAGKGS